MDDVKKEFFYIEFGGRWDYGWEVRMISVDDIINRYNNGVNELVKEDCSLKINKERNIFSLILSEDLEEVFIEVNNKNKELIELCENGSMFEICEKLDELIIE